MNRKRILLILAAAIVLALLPCTRAGSITIRLCKVPAQWKRATYAWVPKLEGALTKF